MAKIFIFILEKKVILNFGNKYIIIICKNNIIII